MTDSKTECKTTKATGSNAGCETESKMKASRPDSRAPGSKAARLPSKENFSEWYHELLMTAEIVDNRYPVKGMCVWFPFASPSRRMSMASSVSFSMLIIRRPSFRS